MAKYDIDIAIHEDGWRRDIPNIEKHTRTVIARALDRAFEHQKHVEISIVLSHDSFIQELNKSYREKDRPTNVLSFPQTEKKDLVSPIPFIALGDIIVSYETISKEAAEQDKSLLGHFTHMLVHGCLHLLHYNHENDADAEEMEVLEIEILNTLNVKNPYQTV